MFGNTQSGPGGLGGFGSPASAASPFGTSAFGASSSNPQPGGGTSLFGQSPGQQSTGLFGSKPAQSSGGGLFGSNTSQPSSGLFGSTAGPSGTGSSLFGQAPQQGGGLFGSSTNQQGAGTGPFTSSTQSTLGTTLNPFGSSSTGGLFGSSSTQQGTGGGLFGTSPSQPSGGTGLFGSPSGQQQGTGTGLFGSTPQQGSGLGKFGSTFGQPSTGGGLFSSNSTQPSTGGGLFSSSTTPQQGNLFGNTSSVARPAFGASGTSSLFGQQPAQQASPFGGSGFLSTPAPLSTSSNLFGQAGSSMPGTGTASFGVAQTPQQQQQQQLIQQRQFWEHELNLLRDTYTPQQAVIAPGTMQQRVADYKFPFRVSDNSTGVPREILLTDHRQVENKLMTQKNEMMRLQQILETLSRSVQGLEGQARGAKDRLEQCRETQMVLMNRFLVILQRIQVLHNINRPFDAKERQLRARLEVMVGRLEDAIRVLNEVVGVVDEEEEEMREQPKKELVCNMEPEHLEMTLQAVHEQQRILDQVAETLSRDKKGVAILKERLESTSAFI